MAELAIGTPVFIWGRPEQNLILIFGEGTYEGYNTHLHPPCPVVRLTDGREISIHYTGVNIGERNSVKAQCDKFKGDIMEWDLERFLRRDLPTIDHRSAHTVGGKPSVNGAPLPPPKTATDKLMYLKREISISQLKIEAHEQAISAEKTIIAEKRAEAAAIKALVLEELSSLDDVPPEAILAAAERIKAERASAAAPATVAETPITEMSQDEFHRLATED